MSSEYTTMLLHFNNSVTQDECGNTWTITGTPSIESGGVFGNCGRFSSDCCIECTTPITLSTNAFTIDFRAKIEQNAGGDIVKFDADNDACDFALRVRLYNNNFTVGHEYYDDGHTYTESFNSVTFNAWHHFAFVCANGTMKLYIDGVSQSVKNYSGSSSGTIKIGNGANFLIDEFRVSNGIARWTDNFTPPTSAYFYANSAIKLIDLGGLKTAIDLIFDAFTTRTAKHINSIESTTSDTIVFKCVDGTTAFTLTNGVSNTFSGATSSVAGTAGLVPAPSTSDRTKFLCGNGSWETVSSSSGSTYTHPTYTAQTGNPTGNQTPTFGGSFTVSQVVSDSTGHVSGMNDRTITIPALPTAASDTLGCIKVGTGLSITNGVLAVNPSELILPSSASTVDHAVWIA